MRVNVQSIKCVECAGSSNECVVCGVEG